MDTNKSKILTIIAGVISLIGAVFMIRIIMIGDEAIESDAANQGIVDGFVWFAIILLAIVTVVTLALSIFNLVKNPQNLKKTLIGVGILVALLLITYFTASDELATDALGEAVVIKDTQGNIITGDAAKSITQRVAGLITFTGVLGAAGLTLIGFGVVRNLVK